MNEVETACAELDSYQLMMFQTWAKSVTFTRVGKKTTICLVTMDSGFEIVGTSACLDADAFNNEIGNEYALKDALNKLDVLAGFYSQEQAFQQLS